MGLSEIIYMKQSGKIHPEASLFDILFTRKMGQKSIITSTGNPISIITNKAQNAISTLLSYSPKQSGSGDPSPQNIRPIEGWTDASLFRNSENFWDEDWEVGGIDSQTGQDVPQSDRIRSKNYMPIKGGMNYYAHTNGKTIGFRFYDESKAYLGYVTALDSAVSVPSTANYFRFILLGTTEYGDDVSINYPSTDTEYHAYNGANLTISLGGTYYGFSIDVERGVLRNTYAIADLGDLNWVKDSQSGHIIFYATLSDGSMDDRFTIYCSSYLVSNSEGYVYDNMIRPYGSSQYRFSRVAIRDDSLSELTANEFKTSVAGGKLAYELATPLELPLTPQTVALLAGANTLWCDGDSITITYRR